MSERWLQRLSLALRRGGEEAFLLGLLPDGATLAPAVEALVQRLNAAGLQSMSVEVAEADDLVDALVTARAQTGEDTVVVLWGVELLPDEEREAFLRSSNFNRNRLGDRNGPTIWVVRADLMRWLGENAQDLIRWGGGPHDLSGLASRQGWSQWRETYRRLSPLPSEEVDSRWIVPLRSWREVSDQLAYETDHAGLPVMLCAQRGVGATEFFRWLQREWPERAVLIPPWSEAPAEVAYHFKAHTPLCKLLLCILAADTGDIDAPHRALQALVGVSVQSVERGERSLKLAEEVSSASLWDDDSFQERAITLTVALLHQAGARRGELPVILLDDPRFLAPDPHFKRGVNAQLEHLAHVRSLLEQLNVPAVVKAPVRCLLAWPAHAWGAPSSVLLPPLSPQGPSGEAREDTLVEVYDVVYRRLPPGAPSWLDDELIKDAWQASGGLLRTLFGLLTSTLRHARSRPDGLPMEWLAGAIRELRDQYVAELSEASFELLKLTHQTGASPMSVSPETLYGLLDSDLILLHEDAGELWLDAPPVLHKLLDA